MDMHSRTVITGVKLAGTAGYLHSAPDPNVRYVTEMTVQTSDDGTNWTDIPQGSVTTPLTDANYVEGAKILFDNVLITRFIRFSPVNWVGAPAMRFDVYEHVEAAAQIQSVSTNARVMYEAFRANSLSSGTLTDFSGNGYNFTLPGTTLDVGSNAFIGNGTVGLLDIQHPNSYPQHTVSYWIYIPTGADVIPNPIHFGTIYTIAAEGSGQQRSSLRYDNNNNIHFMYSGSDQVNNFTTYTRDVWEHLVITYDGGNVKAYINGTLVNSGGASRSTGGSDLRLLIPTGVKLGNFIIYDRILSDAEVIQNYNAGAQYYT
jgi:hypothetical protein